MDLPGSPDAKRPNDALLKAYEEREYFVRALSHDMTANFLVLEHAFRRLKHRLEDVSLVGLDTALAHFESYLSESRRFLDELVTLGKTGTVQMEPEAVDLRRLIDQVANEQAEPLGRRGIRLEVIEPLPPVFCNPRRVKQIVVNLLRNAILHGCDLRSPEVRVSAEPVPPQMVRLEVRDNGGGIPPQMHETAFLPGNRISTMTEGFGMGLAIVRKIAEYYGGFARIVPECEWGMAVEVLLPGLPNSEQAPQAAASHEEPADDTYIGYDPPHERSAPPHRLPRIPNRNPSRSS